MIFLIIFLMIFFYFFVSILLSLPSIRLLPFDVVSIHLISYIHLLLFSILCFLIYISPSIHLVPVELIDANMVQHHQKVISSDYSSLSPYYTTRQKVHIHSMVFLDMNLVFLVDGFQIFFPLLISLLIFFYFCYLPPYPHQ